LYMWPFSRTAVLIPLTWSSLYLVNKWRVSRPVFGLIVEVAERAGFFRVYPKKPEGRDSETAPAPASAPAPRPAADGAKPQAEESIAPAIPIAAVAK
jgi:hypothetical protein